MTREMARAGALDDRACAKLWMQRWMDAGYAQRLIRERLREKQLPERVIDELLCDARHEPDSSRLRAIATARWTRLPAASDPRRRQRLARHLASRGFDLDLIAQVLAELIPVPISYD